VYPIGFLISSGNEDKETWTSFLMKLREACPIMLTQQDDENNVLPFVSISGRDKGLKPALKIVFPQNLELLCAKHIEANVRQRYGAQCATFVFRIAKTFSIRQ
jgi:hypothetical protein